MVKSNAYLILGGNEGNVLNTLSKTLFLIEQRAGNIISKSNIYKTKAWGNTQQPDFFNQAVLIETHLTANELLSALISVELLLGRTRGEVKWSARTIDIDILFYNNDVIDSPSLVIPHPHLQNRRFVLYPLVEIAPQYIHPVFKKNVTTLLSECSDHLGVEIYQDN